MEWIIMMAVLAVAGLSVVNIRTKNQIGRMLENNPVQTAKALEAAPKSGHTLVRTWIVPTKDGRIDAGWRWRCSCGVWGVASGAYSKHIARTNTTEYELGTEKQAITGFKDHATMYREVNDDTFRTKFEELQAEFAEYRNKCYCKETNNDLIKWKDL